MESLVFDFDFKHSLSVSFHKCGISREVRKRLVDDLGHASQATTYYLHRDMLLDKLRKEE